MQKHGENKQINIAQVGDVQTEQLSGPAPEQVQEAPSHAADAANMPASTLSKDKLKLKKKKKLDVTEKKAIDAADAEETAASSVDDSADDDQLATPSAERLAGDVAHDDVANAGESYLAANTAAMVQGSDGDGAAFDVSGKKAGIASAPAATDSGGMPGWVLAGLSLLGVGAAVGGGGGGGSIPSDNPPTLPVPSQTIIRGVVMAGPVLADAGLSVKAYAMDGKEVGGSLVNDKGEYEIAVPGELHGLVRVVLIDNNGNAHDYWDEASGTKDIDELGVIGIIKGGQINYVMLTPLPEAGLWAVQ